MKNKKTLKQRVATALVALTAFTGVAAGGVALAAPAQAATVNYQYWWMGLNRCAMIKITDYNWAEETFYGYRDSQQIVGYVNMSWCRAGIR